MRAGPADRQADEVADVVLVVGDEDANGAASGTGAPLGRRPGAVMRHRDEGRRPSTSGRACSAPARPHPFG